MTRLLTSFLCKKIIIIFIVLIAAIQYSHSQIIGNNIVNENTTVLYSYWDGFAHSGIRWKVTGGTVISTDTSNGIVYNVVIQWGAAGPGKIKFSSTSNYSTLDVTILSPGAASPTLSENHILTIVPRVASTDISTLTDDYKIQSVTYFDGLGRAIQNVAIQSGGNKEDIITHLEYDNLGRQSKSYMPYASSSNKGSYRTNALSATNTFYNTTKYENTTNPYSETLFDGTPLNLIVEQAAPGNDWKEGNTEEHTIKNEYKLVGTSDYVRIYQINNTNGNLIDNGYYKTGEWTVQGAYNTPYLYKFITKNENWVPSDTNDNTTHTFKDYRGRVILSRTFENQVKHDTYYVYDTYGNLMYVLPPKADPSSAKPDSTELAELCFQYKYDDKNRLIEKKIPGKEWEYIVYNKLDQPVLTQHATQLAANNTSLTINQWSFTKYDRFGRVAYTGLMSSNSSRSTLQGILDGASSTYVTKGGATNIAGTTVYYNNDAYPTSISEIHTINYYDDYTFDKPSSTNLPSSYEGQTIVNYNNTDKAKTKGLTTGTKVRVLTTNQWITTVTGYDVKGRAIYVASDNPYFGSVDIIKNKLDFTGAVDKTETSHDRGTTSIDTEDLFTYDHIGRLKKHTQELNNSNVVEVINENTYDELGKLINKGVGGKTTENRLQTVDYTYNIRGWLKTINNVSSLGTDLFGFKINYNAIDHHTSNDKKLFNGNISEIEWKTSNDNSLRWYKFEYDDLNRITSAVDNINRYALSSVQYDKNGNITSLVRKGHINSAATSFGTMDNLVYTYQTKSNKLLRVSDTGNNTYGFKDDYTGSGADPTNDYTYDINGNLLSDANKGITSILWNHINLPTEIKFNNSNTQKINYTYSADGIKVRKVVNDNGAVTTTDYAGAYQYVNNDLKFIKNIEDGYVYPKSGGGFGYAYYYTDQLDNIRLLYTDANGDGTVTSSEIIKEAHFYPFGMVHKGYNNVVNPIGSSFHKYDYQNQERQDELGLNWLQFKYRMHDPAIGRFVSIDPLAADYVHNSTYAFAENKVIKYNELEGLEVYLNKFDRQSYENKSWLGKAATFVGNAGVSLANGAIDVFNYAGDLTDPNAPLTGFSYGANKLGSDTKATAGAISDYAQNTTLSEFGSDVSNALSKVETYEDITGGLFGGALTKVGKFGTISKVSNPIPNRLARVRNAKFGDSPTLGAPGAGDAFVTAASDLKGITSAEGIAKRLTLLDDNGNFLKGPFQVIEFDTPSTGLSSPVFRSNPGFIGGGKTLGGAREFTLPNLDLSKLKGIDFDIKF